MGVDDRPIDVRPGKITDHSAIAEICQETWQGRDIEDYVPTRFPIWITESSGRQQTFVAEVDGEVAGLARVSFLNKREAWCSGLRVKPDYQGFGVGRELTTALLDWAARGGAEVARNLVFSWNGPGLGMSRSIGFDPIGEWRWAYVPPSSDEMNDQMIPDETELWNLWESSDARRVLGGVVLAPSESWALVEFNQEYLDEVAMTLGVKRHSQRMLTGAAIRTRSFDDSKGEKIVEYGFALWENPKSGRELFRKIAHDSAIVGADSCRVLIPETTAFVTDVASFGLEISDSPYFVLGLDLESMT